MTTNHMLRLHHADHADDGHEGPGWRSFDRTDAMFGYHNHHVWAGLDLPSISQMRDNARRLIELNPGLFIRVDQDATRWRPHTAQELHDLPELVVVDVQDCGLDATEAITWLQAQPYDGAMIKLYVGPGWLGHRTCHAAGLDGTSNHMIMRDLLSHAGEVSRMPRSGRVQRRLWPATFLARHPEAVRAAFDYRTRVTRRGHSVLAPIDSPGDYDVANAVTDPEGSRTLREIRDRHWPEASAAAVILVGVRKALAGAGPTPRPGGEVLFDTRRYLADRLPVVGNWAMGLEVYPEDDFDPVSVTRAIAADARAGLPMAAMAAMQVMRSPGADGDVVGVPNPTGAPRLTYSSIPFHGLVSELPWLPADHRFCVEAPRPANREAFTVLAKDLGGPVTLGVSYYARSWPGLDVASALQRLVSDPEGVLLS